MRSFLQENDLIGVVGLPQNAGGSRGACRCAKYGIKRGVLG